MAHMELQKFTTEFVPANYKVNETKALFSVTPGELIIGGCARVLTAFDDTNCTITIGDSNADDYMTSAQIDPQNAGIAIFAGAYMVNSLGKLITNATTEIINAAYTQGDTDGTAGKLRVTIVKGRIEP